MNSIRRWSKRHPRRGKIVMMTGLLMPVLLGMAALTVDTGVLGVGVAELKTVTDAGALAGAQALATEQRFQGPSAMTTIIDDAGTDARGRALSNKVLNATPTIGTPDVNVGYIDPASSLSISLDTGVPSTMFNSVRVSATRPEIPAYFGRLFGAGQRRLNASSTATARNLSIAGFSSAQGQNAQLLPIVLQKDSYNAMVNRTSVDNYSYNLTTNSITTGSDGVYEAGLYPIRTGPGNWGTIKIGVSNNSTSTLGDQIRYGVTPQQMMNAFPSDGVVKLEQTDSSTSPPTSYHIFDGNPGISAGIKDDLASIIGKPVTVPIYDQTGGNGNNAWYRIIGFTGVRIVDVNFKGNPKYVIVQPAFVTDPTAVPDTNPTNDVPWTTGGIISIYLSR